MITTGLDMEWKHWQPDMRSGQSQTSDIVLVVLVAWLTNTSVNNNDTDHLEEI